MKKKTTISHPPPADPAAPYGYTKAGEPRKRPHHNGKGGRSLKEGRPEGRPLKIDMNDPIIRKQVETFGAVWATNSEMAAILGVSQRTIEWYMKEPDPDTGLEQSEFLRIYREKQMGTAASLRRKQIHKAITEGDNTMLIWLGKNLLKQKDKIEHEHTGPEGGPIVTKDITVKDALQAYAAAIKPPVA